MSVVDGDATAWDISAPLRTRDDTEVVHEMTGVDKLRDEGYTSSGIKVSVVDSGVDYKHPALGECFGEVAWSLLVPMWWAIASPMD